MINLFLREPIPPELEAEMTPAVKAAFLALLERVEQLTRQVESLTDQVEKLTPRNSSLPPSTEHPHACQAETEASAGEKTQAGRAKWTQAALPRTDPR